MSLGSIVSEDILGGRVTEVGQEGAIKANGSVDGIGKGLSLSDRVSSQSGDVGDQINVVGEFDSSRYRQASG